MRLLLLLLAAICIILLWLISLAWMMALLLPFPVLIGVVIYFIIRNQHRRAVLRAAVDEEAERQRRLNAQEYRAWQTAVDEDRRKRDRRHAILRRFDNTRDPPKQ